MNDAINDEVWRKDPGNAEASAERLGPWEVTKGLALILPLIRNSIIRAWG
jgi:hypothetical protein